MKEPGVLIAQRRVAVVDNLGPVESVFFGRVECLVQTRQANRDLPRNLGYVLPIRTFLGYPC